MSDKSTRSAMEAIAIYEGLTKSGYKIEAGTSTWAVTEPEDRVSPQHGRAFRTMREVMKWAEGCEGVRFALFVEEERRKKA